LIIVKSRSFSCRTESTLGATKGATLLLFGSTESSVTRVGTWLLMAAPYMPFPPPTLTIARCF
jgi:hypothetical protein